MWTETVVLTGKRNPTRHTKEIGFHLRLLSSTLLGVARIRPGCQANFPGVVTPTRFDAKLQTLIVAMESVFVVHADEKLTAFAELESAVRGRS